MENVLRGSFPVVEFRSRQTDIEGGMAGFIRSTAESAGIVINPGAWTGYSFALHDAFEQCMYLK